jgi:hypothetical protein
MRLNETPQVPRIRTGLMEWVDEWLRAFSANWLRLAQQVNGVSEGRIAPWHTAHTAHPVAGKYDQGDFVRNSAPVVAGVVPCDYIVMGWVCTEGGTPGTWEEVRTTLHCQTGEGASAVWWSIISDPMVNTMPGWQTSNGASYYYKVDIHNGGTAVSSGAVTFTDIPPDELTVTAIEGDGWTIDLEELTATRSDAINPGQYYPAIWVAVTCNTVGPVTGLIHDVSVDGGGATEAATYRNEFEIIGE